MLSPNARARIAQLLASAAQDGSGLLGAALVSYGASQIYPPLGNIVAGGFLLVGAWLSARKAG